MQGINVKIINQKMYKTNVYISQNLAKKFEIAIECKARLKTSVNSMEKRVLLDIEMNLQSKDEEVKVELAAETVFELDQLPDNYDEIAEQKMVPMAKESLLNSLDDILNIMGYKKMELAQRI